jgi:Derlin-2/3
MDLGPAALAGGNGFDLMSWYMEIPVISRLYFTSAFLTTAACAVDLISPFNLYFNANLIFQQGQLWRLVTSFLFFGMFSIDFLFHMYFLVRYCRLLEEGDFRGRTANFVLLLLFGITSMVTVAPFFSVHFLGSSLTFMMTYIWGRRNPSVRMSFLGVFTFSAPYLPWVMLTFSVLLGNPITMDVIGILVGHSYYFLEYIYPTIADIRQWRVRKILVPPKLLHWACGSYHGEDEQDEDEDLQLQDGNHDNVRRPLLGGGGQHAHQD